MSRQQKIILQKLKTTGIQRPRNDIFTWFNPVTQKNSPMMKGKAYITQSGGH